MVERLQIERAEERHQLRTRISELAAENERLRRLVMAQSRAIHSPEALSRTGAVKVGYANSTAPDNPFVTPAPEGQQPVAKAVELSGNAGELIEKMAEAIRGDTTSDDTPWAALSEDRKTGWRGDAERALAVVKEYLTARRPSEQAVTEAAGPFVTFANHAIEKTDDGWVWRTSGNERICDWFGPSDFGALKAAMEAEG